MSSPRRKTERSRDSRLQRARANAAIDARSDNAIPPAGAVMANAAELLHNNPYGRLPRFYVDRAISCRECGTEELWTAEDQKWWYEVAKGHMDSTAVRCRACRRKEKARKAEARRVHVEGLARKVQGGN